MVMLPLFDLCPRRGTRRERAVALGKLYRLSAPARQRSGHCIDVSRELASSVADRWAN